MHVAMADAPHDPGIAAVMLADGRARRFPGKLEHTIEGVPLALRTYRALRATGWPIYIAANQEFSRELDALLDAPRLLDEHPGEGPLQALVSACRTLGAARVLAVAADLPYLEPAVLRQLAGAWRNGDEAIIPIHDGRIEPLAALYARDAVLRESLMNSSQNGSMHELVERLASRFVLCDARFFYNVNRPEDLAGSTASTR